VATSAYELNRNDASYCVFALCIPFRRDLIEKIMGLWLVSKWSKPFHISKMVRKASITFEEILVIFLWDRKHNLHQSNSKTLNSNITSKAIFSNPCGVKASWDMFAREHLGWSEVDNVGGGVKASVGISA